ncbi:MAG TPA: hypothetical protein VEL75_11720, partial [Candidatus Methylomirabilis sp.]|nr:hypothetical protein [Candidatus Methylomirabilis sp.]
ELRQLREHQKLPWVETDPARACALVAEALDLHHERGTAPPVEFSRWHRLFSAVPGGPPADRLPASPAKEVDARLLERSAELLEIPEFGGWFVDPGEIHEQSLALLQLRESRLVVSEQIKGEREAAIVDDVVSSQFASEARRRWARRVNEMALIFRSTGRDDLAQLTGATAQALADEGRPAGRIPFVRALAMRGLTVGAEVALGRAKLADVSRSPSRTTAR